MTSSTTHQIIIGAAQNMNSIADESVQLVVTSPPYPMIEMWDDIMSNQNPKIKSAFADNNSALVYELMHIELDKVWSEVSRVLSPGGFACINIGDATRTIDGVFSLYPNHARIIQCFLRMGMMSLPNILWRKQTNAPNKFMGSGMLAAGAYVTLEHEWILIFRKGNKRNFKSDAEKLLRKQSAYFWEERNVWFSDLWDLKGTKQKMDSSETRKRSAAYPMEIPYRLINMYSLQHDTVLDPFMGTGTTSIAAIASKRHSIGYEIDPLFAEIISDHIEQTSIADYNQMTNNRLTNHQTFIKNRIEDPTKSEIKYYNHKIAAKVMTNQETELKLPVLKSLNKKSKLFFETDYEG